jgi:hypothetical protein
VTAIRLWLKELRDHPPKGSVEHLVHFLQISLAQLRRLNKLLIWTMKDMLKAKLLTGLEEKVHRVGGTKRSSLSEIRWFIA